MYDLGSYYRTFLSEQPCICWLFQEMDHFWFTYESTLCRVVSEWLQKVRLCTRYDMLEAKLLSVAMIAAHLHSLATCSQVFGVSELKELAVQPADKVKVAEQIEDRRQDL